MPLEFGNSTAWILNSVSTGSGKLYTLDDNAFLNRLTDNAMLVSPIAVTGNARALERFDYTGSTRSYTGIR